MTGIDKERIQSVLLNLPHKLKVQYALNCASDAKHLLKHHNLKAFESANLWLQGKMTLEEIAEEEIAEKEKLLNEPNDIDWQSHHARIASNIGYNLMRTITFTHNNSTAADWASSIPYWTAKALNIDLKFYYNKLIEFINNLSETEKIIYNIESIRNEYVPFTSLPS